ncbi:UvrD-helicase domain-containing protein [Lysobacter sp. N42]|uniref:UvrD-helicase domain-containing protein n=1 Tax=Lysobacter sp. N42 TaxID=2545719 RepID=UPI001FB7ECAA|nr:exodeoxyribonuclease V subunit beta [Lysobacter sp. N42]
MSIVELPPPMLDAPGEPDPYLDLPLTGLHRIEASAGTGKTFTLATLVTRLVVERGLRMGQILAVTFTEAATQELRARLRRRLVLTARVAAGLPCDGDAHEIALCRRIVERRQAVEDAAALRARLVQAARELDLAAVHTIHGFCARVLSEHALEAGEPFAHSTLLGNDRELREDVAADVWRMLASDDAWADLLPLLWKAGPEALAADLVELMRAPRVVPDAAMPGESPLPALKRAAASLRAAWMDHGEEVRACIEAALADGVLNRAMVKDATLAKLWPAMHDWCSRSAPLPEPHEKLELLTLEKLTACLRKGRDLGAVASPVFDATRDYLAAKAELEAWTTQREIALLHRVRDLAARRMAQLKRQRRVRCFDDLIDGVAAALDGPQGRTLARRLRGQFHAALVDEFQDTDARQWSIFRRLFGEDDSLAPLSDEALDFEAAAAPRFLALIGDPKQAIYGFRGGDVHTYLAAGRVAADAPPLLRNFRSRPCVLRGIERLYANAGAAAFVDDRIAFRAVAPGGLRGDGACLRDGVPAPGLTLRRVPARADGRDIDAEDSRALATRACVEAVHETLALAQVGRLAIDGRAVEPGDLAVLVRTHREAQRIQQGLSAVGIPAVVAGQSSLFATESALEMLALLEALTAPADPLRLHAALATVLLGFDAADIDALLRDDARRARELERALGWRERWLRAGPLALVNELCARAAPRLLELVDGERRLSDLMQLGEALQQAWQRALGPQGLVDWLRARIAAADDHDPEQQLRLESDARRVQVLTVHKSKGLEFPFVFLPFAGIGRKARSYARCMLDGPDGRVLHLAPGDEDKKRAAREDLAEEARLLYVALTRAQHALWLCAGPMYQAKATALAPLLGDMATLTGDGILVDDRVPADDLAPLRFAAPVQLPRARTARRALSRDWAIYSFSALARQAAGPVETLLPRGGREDEADEAPVREAVDDPRFVGARFGDVVHGALERVDFAAWAGWAGGEVPAGQQDALVDAFRAEGYAQADIEAGLPLLGSLVGHTLAATLPEGTRLCDVPLGARRAEMEFHFALKDVPVDALLATVQAHGLLADRQGFGTRRRLDGLMTGKIDLVYARGGQYFVLDYKTNRLPDYSPASLERAMHEGEYTLQAAIYTLALHRWLRFRLGEGYDYERCVGGVRYVFCRGVDARRAPSPGIHAQRLPRELVDALDALFAGGHA